MPEIAGGAAIWRKAMQEKITGTEVECATRMPYAKRFPEPRDDCLLRDTIILRRRRNERGNAWGAARISLCDQVGRRVANEKMEEAPDTIKAQENRS